MSSKACKMIQNVHRMFLMISRMKKQENLAYSPEKRWSVRSSRVVPSSPWADLDFNRATAPAPGYKGEHICNEHKSSGLQQRYKLKWNLKNESASWKWQSQNFFKSLNGLINRRWQKTRHLKKINRNYQIWRI